MRSDVGLEETTTRSHSCMHRGSALGYGAGSWLLDVLCGTLSLPCLHGSRLSFRSKKGAYYISHASGPEGWVQRDSIRVRLLSTILRDEKEKAAALFLQQQLLAGVWTWVDR